MIYFFTTWLPLRQGQVLLMMRSGTDGHKVRGEYRNGQEHHLDGSERKSPQDEPVDMVFQKSELALYWKWDNVE